MNHCDSSLNAKTKVIMKKKYVFLTALVLAAVSIFAAVYFYNSDLIVRIKKGIEGKTIEVQLANLQGERTHVAVQDMEGKMWFSEYVWKEDGYAKKLKMTTLPEGHYLCFVNNAKGLFTQTFLAGVDDVAFFGESNADYVGKNQLIYTGNERAAMARITPEGFSTVGLQLANLQGEFTRIQLNTLGEAIAYEKSFSNQPAYAEKINLDGLAKGQYFLYVKIGEAGLIQFMDWTKDGLKLGKQEMFDFAPEGHKDLAQN